MPRRYYACRHCKAKQTPWESWAGVTGVHRVTPHARLITTNSIRYNSDKGLNQQRTLKFDAAMLKPGENTMTFTVPGGDLQSAVVWDYLRLELNEDQKP